MLGKRLRPVIGGSGKKRVGFQGHVKRVADSTRMSVDLEGRDVVFTRLARECNVDVPKVQPQKCRQCVRFYDRHFFCHHLEKRAPPG